MRSFSRFRKPSWLLVLPVVLLAACGGDDPVRPPPPAEFDPARTEATIEEMVASIEGSDEALVSLGLAMQALGSAGIDYALLPDPASPTRLLPRVQSAPRLALAAAAEEPAFLPAEVAGKTFVFDVDSARYVIDETRTGAPANGVRFVYYAINPATDAPAEPLNELGYLDLTDESSAFDFTLGFRLVDTSGDADVALLDYATALTARETAGSVTLFIDAVGFLSDGTAQLDFDLRDSYTISESTTEIAFETDYALELPGRDVSLHLVTEGLADWELGAIDLTSRMMVTDGADEVVLEFSFNEAETLNGRMDFNGRTVVLISGTMEAPTFIDADGSELDASEIAPLARIWSAFERFSAFAAGVFDPVMSFG